MKRIWIAAFALLTASISNVYAAPPYYYYPGAYRAPVEPTEATSPDQIVRQGIDRLKGFLARGGRADSAEVKSFLDKEISPYFDFDYMAEWVGGAMYKDMDDAQKAQFAAKLKQMFFSALARNLGTYSTSPPDITIYPARVRPYAREVSVLTLVRPANGYPMRLQFRFYRGSEGWRVFDVTADGTSAVMYYRRFFQDVARRGSIEACCR